MKRGIRALLKWAWVYSLFWSGAMLWAKWRLRRRNAIVVLTFHRVLDDADYAATHSPRGMLIRARTFAALAGYLSRHFAPVRLGNGMPAWEFAGPRLRVALTFDDGWLDNATTAWPVLEKHQLPVAIFVCTEMVGRQSPFWPERVTALCRASGHPCAESLLESLKECSPEEREERTARLAAMAPPGTTFCPADATMSWDDLERLDRQGVALGSHTHSHQILTNIPPAAALRELRQSRTALEYRLGKPCLLCAYPNGNCSPSVRAMAEEAGYHLAFTTREGAWAHADDPLLIPRINIWEGSVVGPTGRFSRIMTQYTACWKPYRAGFRSAVEKPATGSSVRF